MAKIIAIANQKGGVGKYVCRICNSQIACIGSCSPIIINRRALYSTSMIYHLRGSISRCSVCRSPRRTYEWRVPARQCSRHAGYYSKIGRIKQPFSRCFTSFPGKAAAHETAPLRISPARIIAMTVSGGETGASHSVVTVVCSAVS